MSIHNQTMNPYRLFQAAEAVTVAVTETADDTTGRCANPIDLLGTDAEPECLVAFTRAEVEQATLFLLRLGYLEMRRDI